MSASFRSVALVAAFLGVAGASANISAYIVGTPMDLPWSGIAVTVYDIHVVVESDFLGNDDWTAARLEMWTTTDFYQDPMNDTNPPNPAFFDGTPDSEFTSYYTTPSFIPNTPYGGSVQFAYGPEDAPGYLRADWFDTVDTAEGDFVVARMTVLGGGTLTGTFCYASVNHPQFQCIPEPAGLALLVLGGLVVARRR